MIYIYIHIYMLYIKNMLYILYTYHISYIIFIISYSLCCFPLEDQSANKNPSLDDWGARQPRFDSPCEISSKSTLPLGGERLIVGKVTWFFVGKSCFFLEMCLPHFLVIDVVHFIL